MKLLLVHEFLEAGAVEMVPRFAAVDEEEENAQHAAGEQEEHEVAVVALRDAVAEHHAVMVELEAAHVARRTVRCFRWSSDSASGTPAWQVNAWNVQIHLLVTVF